MLEHNALKKYLGQLYFSHTHEFESNFFTIISPNYLHKI